MKLRFLAGEPGQAGLGGFGKQPFDGVKERGMSRGFSSSAPTPVPSAVWLLPTTTRMLTPIRTVQTTSPTFTPS